MQNIGRAIEILIGPWEETNSNNDPSQALSVYSDGSQEGLRISFHINKNWNGATNASNILIYNLNEDTRTQINKRNMYITVSAGYKTDTKLSLLFTGGILSAYSERQGADIVTRIVAWDMGASLSTAIVSKTFSNGTKVINALMDTLKFWPGIKTDPTSVSINKDIVGVGGLSLAGQMKDALDTMGRQFGFTWSVQNGMFYARGDQTETSIDTVNKTATQMATVLDGNFGSLISITPLLSGQLQAYVGARIKTFIQSGLEVYNYVSVINSVNKSLDNLYKIHVVDFRGDTFSDEWYCDIQALIETSTVLTVGMGQH